MLTTSRGGNFPGQRVLQLWHALICQIMLAVNTPVGAGTSLYMRLPHLTERVAQANFLRNGVHGISLNVEARDDPGLFQTIVAQISAQNQSKLVYMNDINHIEDTNRLKLTDKHIA